MAELSFFTPIVFQHKNKSNCEYLLEKVDNYFYLGRKKAFLFKNQKKIVLKIGQIPLITTLLKIISYCTIIFPLIALCLKIILRKKISLDIKKISTVTVISPEVMNDLKLNLDEIKIIDEKYFDSGKHQFIPRIFTLEKAISDVIEAINYWSILAKEQDPSQESFLLPLVPPWEKEGSNLYFYRFIGAVDEYSQEVNENNAWLHRILKGLVQANLIKEYEFFPKGCRIQR